MLLSCLNQAALFVWKYEKKPPSLNCFQLLWTCWETQLLHVREAHGNYKTILEETGWKCFLHIFLIAHILWTWQQCLLNILSPIYKFHNVEKNILIKLQIPLVLWTNAELQPITTKFLKLTSFHCNLIKCPMIALSSYPLNSLMKMNRAPNLKICLLTTDDQDSLSKFQ